MAIDESIYPRMVYRAQPDERGKIVVVYAVCQDRDAYEALGGGWYPGPNEAEAGYEKSQQEIGQAAAHRAYEDRNMSGKAKKEAAEAEDETRHHVAEVPESSKSGKKKDRD